MLIIVGVCEENVKQASDGNFQTIFPKAEYQTIQQHCRRKAVGPAERSASLQKIVSAENVSDCKQKIFLQKDVLSFLKKSQEELNF